MSQLAAARVAVPTPTAPADALGWKATVDADGFFDRMVRESSASTIIVSCRHDRHEAPGSFGVILTGLEHARMLSHFPAWKELMSAGARRDDTPLFLEVRYSDLVAIVSLAVHNRLIECNRSSVLKAAVALGGDASQWSEWLFQTNVLSPLNRKESEHAAHIQLEPTETSDSAEPISPAETAPRTNSVPDSVPDSVPAPKTKHQLLHDKAIEALIQAGGDLGVALKEHDQLVCALIRGGSTGDAINAQTIDGMTALMWASQLGHQTCVHALIMAGAALDIQTKEGRTALMLAAEFGQEWCVWELINAGAAILTQTKEGFTALMIASEMGYEGCARALIRSGAAINTQNAIGWTALMLAAKDDETAVVRALLQAGADVDIITNGGETAMDIAACSSFVYIKQREDEVREEEARGNDTRYKEARNEQAREDEDRKDEADMEESRGKGADMEEARKAEADVQEARKTSHKRSRSTPVNKMRPVHRRSLGYT